MIEFDVLDSEVRLEALNEAQLHFNKQTDKPKSLKLSKSLKKSHHPSKTHLTFINV